MFCSILTAHNILLVNRVGVSFPPSSYRYYLLQTDKIAIKSNLYLYLYLYLYQNKR